MGRPAKPRPAPGERRPLTEREQWTLRGDAGYLAGTRAEVDHEARIWHYGEPEARPDIAARIRDALERLWERARKGSTT